MTIARLGLKLKVIGQIQRSMSSAYGRGNAVTRSVSPRSRSRTVFLVQPVIAVQAGYKMRGIWICTFHFVRLLAGFSGPGGAIGLMCMSVCPCELNGL